jgi:hypothetical protein
MTRDEQDKSEYNIENSMFCFFEFFLISSRYQHEPTRIDDEDHTYHGEECVEIGEELPDDPDTRLQIHFFDITFA